MHVRDEIEEKRLLKRHRWENYIKMDHKETGHENVDWIHLALGKVQRQTVMNMVMNLWVP
jgi:hypothetical protein